MSEKFPFDHFINFDKVNNNDDLGEKPEQNQQESFKQPVIQNHVHQDVTNYNHEQDSGEFNYDELKSITDEILNILIDSINPARYNAFFSNTFTVCAVKGQSIEFSVTTNFIKKMCENHYLSNISQAVFELMGQEYQIEINVINSKKSLSSNKNNVLNSVNESKQVSYTQEIFQSNIDDNKNLDPTIPTTKPTSVKNMSFKIDDTYTQSRDEIIDEVNSKVMHHNSGIIYGMLDKNKNFDNFIVGQSNNMAHAFSIAVAKDPGNIYPQLYLYGNSGLGKTHLLHAVCNYIRETKPHLRICLTTANELTKEMVYAIQNNNQREDKIGQFRRKYTELVDVLIIDDIHELANRARTQSEFFYIFNELQSKKKQLIFTSDKPPKEINGFEERIRTRLTSALLIDVKNPDLETRIAILKRKAVEKDIYIDDDVINLIASCIQNNVRELEGNLIKLGAYSDLMNIDIDLEIAKEQLNLTEGFEEKILTIDNITKAVANYFKLPLGDIKGKARKKELVFARHIAMYMTHKILKRTLEEIGDYFDKRDHSTVIHAIDKINKLIKENTTKITTQIYEIESTL